MQKQTGHQSGREECFAEQDDAETDERGRNCRDGGGQSPVGASNSIRPSHPTRPQASVPTPAIRSRATRWSFSGIPTSSRQPNRTRDECRIAGHSQHVPAIELIRLPVGDSLTEVPITFGVAHNEEGALFIDVQIVLQPDRSPAANDERRQNNPKQRATVHHQIPTPCLIAAHTRATSAQPEKSRNPKAVPVRWSIPRMTGKPR